MICTVTRALFMLSLIVTFCFLLYFYYLKKLVQLSSHHSCEKLLMERFFLKHAKDLFIYSKGAIMAACSS